LQRESCKKPNFARLGRRLDKAVAQAGRTVEAAGERLHQSLKNEGWDEEADRMIAYLNDEVVPAVRAGSGRALKAAAKKLSQFADFLDEHRA